MRLRFSVPHFLRLLQLPLSERYQSFLSHFLSDWQCMHTTLMSPFVNPQNHTSQKWLRFYKIFERIFRGNTIRPSAKNADRRIGIVSSIQLICVFIFTGRFFPGDGRVFFDKSIPVRFCWYGLSFMAATSFSRRFQYRNRVIDFEKETAALISQKPP